MKKEPQRNREHREKNHREMHNRKAGTQENRNKYKIGNTYE
jgi:hypothetical protein